MLRAGYGRREGLKALSALIKPPQHESCLQVARLHQSMVHQSMNKTTSSKQNVDQRGVHKLATKDEQMALQLPPLVKPVLPHEALNKYLKDTSKNKANLTVGTYWDEQETLAHFDTVRAAKEKMSQKFRCTNYPNQGGPPGFRQLVTEFTLGKDHPAIREGRATSFQTLGSAGGLQIAGKLMEKFFDCKRIYVSDPCWVSYPPIFELCDIPEITRYRYLRDGMLDFDATLYDLHRMENGSVVVFQGCSHNPSGIDPSIDQWHQIAQITRDKRLRMILDVAYHGYISGDPEQDLLPARIMADYGIDFICTQSFSKNLTMYADRVGALTVVANSPQHLDNLEVAVNSIIYYSIIAPPVDAALAVEAILEDEEMMKKWKSELLEATHRLNENRKHLHECLQKIDPHPRWNRIAHQKGLYSYIDISKEQVDELREKHSVYMLPNGRINMSGLNKTNIFHVAVSLARVFQNTLR